MKYILKPAYRLRGWEKLPWALVNRRTTDVTFVNSGTMDALKLCNGKIDVDNFLVPQHMRDIIAQLVKEKIVEPCGSGAVLDPKQDYHMYPARYMRSVHWSMTGRCNYRCKHCYMSAPHAKYGELSHETCMDMIDQMSECGIMRISLTGGEPLVRSDFMELVDALLEREIYISTIYSNGRLVTPKLLDQLDERGIRPEFNMSYDGTNWHDWLRGVEGAERDVERAFELCRERNFPTGAEMCIHKYNKHTLRESVRRLGELGCRSLKTNPVSAVGEWVAQEENCSVSIGELYDIYMEYIPHFYEDGMPLDLMLGGFFLADRGSNEYSIPAMKNCTDADKMCICGHARNSMYISAEGRALPCMALSGMEIQREFPLIPDTGMATCLNSSRYIELVTTRASEFFAHNPECASCGYAMQCVGGCRASALETTPADILGPDMATCGIFKGNYIDKIQALLKGIDPNLKFVM